MFIWKHKENAFWNTKFWFIINSFCIFECTIAICPCGIRSRIMEMRFWITWNKVRFFPLNSDGQCSRNESNQSSCRGCFILTDNFVISRAATATKLYSCNYETCINKICENERTAFQWNGGENARRLCEPQYVNKSAEEL